MLKKLRVFAFIPMLLMMLVIWGFSANSGETSSTQSMGIVMRVVNFVDRMTGEKMTSEEKLVWENRIHTPIRKLAHMTEYMIFACTVSFPFLLYDKKKKWITRVTFFGCTCYAAMDEIHQLFVPNRSGQFKDVCIDAIGILIGIVIFRLFYGATHSSEI